RDLVSAHRSGLLVLGDLHAPFELAACVLGPFGGNDRGVLEAIPEARRVAGTVVAIDAPEYILPPMRPAAGPAYVRELDFSLRATSLRGVVNLNVAAAPRWAIDLAEGPLFAERHASCEPELFATQAENLLEHLLAAGRRRQGSASEQVGVVRVDWHLNKRDFEGSAARRLLQVARRLTEGAPLAFVFDHPKRVSLAEGLDRPHP